MHNTHRLKKSLRHLVRPVVTPAVLKDLTDQRLSDITSILESVPFDRLGDMEFATGCHQPTWKPVKLPVVSGGEFGPDTMCLCGSNSQDVRSAQYGESKLLKIWGLTNGAKWIGGITPFSVAGTSDRWRLDIQPIEIRHWDLDKLIEAWGADIWTHLGEVIKRCEEKAREAYFPFSAMRTEVEFLELVYGTK